MQFKRTTLLVLVGALCSYPIAINAAEFTSTPPVLSTEHLLIAQAFLDDRCPDQYVYVLGETSNYSVVICGERSTGAPTHYLGVSKQNGSSILLPLSAHTTSRFFARNGNYTYTLDLTSQTLRIGISGRRPLIEAFTPETP